MSLLSLVLLSLGAVYACFFLYSLFRLIWVQGAKGKEVDAGDAFLVFWGHLWTLLTLPKVALKAARK